MTLMEENISNFESCCEFFETEYSQAELYEFLKSGSLAERQLACLRINELETDEQAEILMENLTGIDGKVREAVSFKLLSFIPQKPQFFRTKKYYDIFLDAIIDINGNICRNVLSAIKFLADDEDFCDYVIRNIIARAYLVLDKIDTFDYKDRKYVTNKEVFKLYWYLEGLSIFDVIENDNLDTLLERSAKIEEYTIREKVAQILSKLPQCQRENFESLNFDNNFYVSRALKTI